MLILIAKIIDIFYISMVFFVRVIKYHQRYSKYHQINFKNSDETKGNNKDVQQHLPV